MRPIVPLLLLLVAALAAGTIYQLRRSTALQQEAFQARERAEQVLRDSERAGANQGAMAEDDRGAGVAELAGLRTELEKAKKRILELEVELGSEIRQRKDVDGLIEDTAAALRAERERHNQEIWEARRFMPEGVGVALVALNECLRADHHPEFRFLRAMKIEERVLHDVQALDRDPTTLSGTIYIAKQVTVDLDRAKGTVTMTFKDGYRRGPNGREAFAATGTVVTFPDIDGKEWESRLPFLVRAAGEYPVEVAQARKSKMERRRRDGWLRRVNELLAKATTEKRYQLETFRDLESGRFSEALLLGYDDRKKLAMSVEAEWLSIQVDERGEYVELLMLDGVLRKRGGETPIPDGGYRIRLTGIEPSQASEGMLGMVKRK